MKRKKHMWQGTNELTSLTDDQGPVTVTLSKLIISQPRLGNTATQANTSIANLGNSKLEDLVK